MRIVVKERQPINLMDIMEVAQQLADDRNVDVRDTYLLFAGGALRAVSKTNGSFVHGYDQCRMVGGALCESNTVMPLSKVLSFAYFCEQFSPAGITAWYEILENGNQGIRVLFNYRGNCDYFWNLTPINEANFSYVK